MKKKNQFLKNISDILIHNKRILAALMVIFIVFFAMAYDLGVLAAGNFTMYGFYPGQGFGAQDIPAFDSETVVAFYNLSGEYDISNYPVLTRETVSQLYEIDGNDPSLVDFGSSFFYSSTYMGNARAGYEGDYPYSVIKNVKTASGLDITMPDNAYTLCYLPWGTADSSHVPISCRFSGSGNFAIIKNYIVSDAPFTLIGYCLPRAYSQNVFIADIQEPSGNGFYCQSAPWFQSAYGTLGTYVNCPMYLPSSDGASGFTNFSDESTDFTFSGNNFDFNNNLKNGIIVDPSAPQESETEKVSKSYMNFYATDSYAGDALTMMYHNINFNPNDYMRLHGEQFQIVVQHECTYKGSDMDAAVNFTMPEQTVKVDMLLAKSPRGEFSIHLDLHDMKDSYGVDVRQYLLNTLHSPSGARMPIYQDNVNIFGDIGQALSDAVSDLTPLNLSRYTSTNLVVIGNQYNNFIDEFYITSKIFVRSAPPDYNYESGFNLTKYNVRSGEYSIEQNDGGTNLYPPANNPNTDGTPSVIPSGGSGGSVGVTVNSGGVNNSFSELANSVANAIIQSGAIQNTVNPTQSAYGGSIESGAVVVNAGGSQAGFQLSPGEWTEYGNFVQSTANAMQETLSAGNETRRDGGSDNNFINVLKDVYSVFPPQFWVFTFAAVGTVTTVSIWKTARSH